MRSRHFPRLCRSCDAPMARQEDTCWSCGAAWDRPAATRNAWDVIPGGRAAGRRRGDQPPVPAIISEARTAAQARPEVDHLVDEARPLAAEGSQRIAAQIAAVQ